MQERRNRGAETMEEISRYKRELLLLVMLQVLGHHGIRVGTPTNCAKMAHVMY